jgi:hypothetical protein
MNYPNHHIFVGWALYFTKVLVVGHQVVLLARKFTKNRKPYRVLASFSLENASEELIFFFSNYSITISGFLIGINVP